MRKQISLLYPESEAASISSLVLAHFGYSNRDIILAPNQEPGPDSISQINEIVSDIHKGRPIQYILGYTRFDDLRILVDENVLIPRPETEEMAVKIFQSQDKAPKQILDLGTGSGCLALAMKKHFPTSRVTAVDISEAALQLARKNGTALELEVNWARGDMLSPAFPKVWKNFDLIVSNPPYVTEGEQVLMQKNVLDFEPRRALFVKDENPLQYYEAIARLAREVLADKGKLWLEINERFGREIASLMDKEGIEVMGIHKDIHEKDRFIEARQR